MPHHGNYVQVMDPHQSFFGMQENVIQPQIGQIIPAGQPQHQIYDMQMPRSQSLMVPQPSYAMNNGIEDMLLDESPGDMSSMDHNPNVNQYAANPYEVAKRRFYAQQKEKQASYSNLPNQSSSNEKDSDQMQLMRQQASDPSSYTAQEVNNHSLPQA